MDAADSLTGATPSSYRCLGIGRGAQMAAGDSARARSAQLTEQASFLEDLYAKKRLEALNFAKAAESELTAAGYLKALNQFGWRVLEDRRWPGSRRANVDFIVVGPGGVVVVDAKAWRELEIRDGSIFRGDACEGGEVAKLTALLDTLSLELSETGLAATALRGVIVFTNHDPHPTSVGPMQVMGIGHVATWLMSLGVRLGEAEIEHVAKAVAKTCPPMETEARPKRKRKKRVLSEADASEMLDIPALVDEDELTKAQIEAVLSEPIEDWMTFLHPHQARLVPTNWKGPARVRGPAGTGKTVVALHRAVHLANRAKEPVLVTSFVKTLPRVLESLAQRLSPSAADNIEFLGVHALAFKILRDTYSPVNLDLQGSRDAFNRVWRGTDAAQHLGRIDSRPSYWREEIDHVLKGRGLSDFEEYRTLDRIGRKTPLNEDARRQVWNLYVAYDEALAAHGIADFNDVLIKALDVAQLYADARPYSSVIVDEVQDLNLVAMRLLATLAGDRPNSLLIVGDGQQAVYPGGFRLGEAGVDVRGRATVLKLNYRNTKEILRTATRVVSADQFDDLDGAPQSGERESSAMRDGHEPLIVEERSQARLDRALSKQIQATREFHHLPWGDMAVLVATLKDVEHYERILRRAGIPTIELTRYDGVTVEQVKVGTFKRAKGLDFKYVLMPGMSRGKPEIWRGETFDAYEERCARQRREEYVGMTRARDGLWLGYLLEDRRPRF